MSEAQPSSTLRTSDGRGPGSESGATLFWVSAFAALALHGVLLFATGPLHGGGDLKPHLRLIELMGERPAIRSTYAPVYHAVGALLAPLIGLASYPKVFGWLSAMALIGGFRFLQTGARVPDAASALFAWSPYTFALSWCLPKIEGAGYALAFLGLGFLLRRRYLPLALSLVAALHVHTAAALFLGLCGGVLALAHRDVRALIALGIGSLGVLPLLIAHLQAGCSLAESLLFSPGDYLRTAERAGTLDHPGRLLALAGPVALAAAAVGAAALWRLDRALAWLCAVVALLYLNEFWLSPFGVGTTLNLQRGLTVLALPVSLAGGVALAGRGRIATGVVAACAVWAVGACLLAVPDSCYVQRIDLDEISRLSVDRCMFRWRFTEP